MLRKKTEGLFAKGAMHTRHWRWRWLAPSSRVLSAESP